MYTEIIQYLGEVLSWIQIKKSKANGQQVLLN